MAAAWPSLRDLVPDFLGRAYAEDECWLLVMDLIRAGGLVPPHAEPAAVIREAKEVWWQDDPRDPLTLVQPWDWWLMRRFGPAVGHVGLVVDQTYVVHLRPTAGVCLEPLRRSRARLLQIARLACVW